MSHKWTADAFGLLSDCAMEEVCTLVLKLPWNITHDNANFPLRVFSQWLHNQSHFISSCTATIALHCDQMFNFSEILYGNSTADTRMEAQDAYFVLRLLIDSPAFKDWPGHGTAALDPPSPIHKLQTGLENATKLYILSTVPFEEASYDGIIRIMLEWFGQLQLDSDDEQKQTTIEHIITWLGDQLTMDRLCGLWKYRHEDYNSYDHMDWMIPVFSWLHLVMVLANSLHKQYLSTSANIGGLQQAFDMLNRKGLLDNLPDKDQDQTKWQWTMWNADVLPYLQL
ncbi:hypothetical protein B0H10DRAFT_2167602 [Mycena sp. CBHHK59/15]|nr:hypothetical protein B0H10DRAFT_2167602 [Mycena sp. CBHHK59/15]